jgi:hypothetical protein
MIDKRPQIMPMDEDEGRAFGQQPIDTSAMPREVNKMIDEADRDSSMYMGNPQIAGQRSFRMAVAGIEDGDYQGLEQLDFGSIDGTPAVAFIDEDGQRQTFRLTMPQWTAALETRSRARKQLEQEYKTDALKKALRPQYDMLLKNVPGAQDPVAQAGWRELFELDPDTAYALAGGALRKDSKMEVLYGREQPEGFVEATNAMLKQQYKQKMEQFRVLDSGTVDIATKGGLAAAQAMVRPPEASHLPLEMTPSDWLSVNNATILPMVNLIQQASMPLGLPGMDKPIVAPAPDMDGNYRESTVRNWLGQFNMSVVQPLGWMPYDFDNPVHQQQIIEMLNAYNSNRTGAITRGGVQQTVQPRPQASRDAGLMSQEEPQQSANKAMSSAEQFFQRYEDFAFERPVVYGEKPSDPNAATQTSVQALLDAHEENERLKAQGKAPNKYPPPQELAEFYKAVTGG